LATHWRHPRPQERWLWVRALVRDNQHGCGVACLRRDFIRRRWRERRLGHLRRAGFAL